MSLPTRKEIEFCATSILEDARRIAELGEKLPRDGVTLYHETCRARKDPQGREARKRVERDWHWIEAER